MGREQVVYALDYTTSGRVEAIADWRLQGRSYSPVTGQNWGLKLETGSDGGAKTIATGPIGPVANAVLPIEEGAISTRQGFDHDHQGNRSGFAFPTVFQEGLHL